MQRPAQMTEASVVQALMDQVPFAQMSGIRATNVAKSGPFDVRFDLESGTNKVCVYAEIEQAISPRQLETIAPWIARLKAIEKDAAFAIICPALSQQAQTYCMGAGIDFLDLAGNISINVPGRFVLQRTGQRSKDWVQAAEGPREVNVFSGRFSRILRVLLQNPRTWTLSDIAQELEKESRDNALISEVTDRDSGGSFTVSLGTISKALSTLEEQLWVRRRGSAVVLPEPKRLLLAWTTKYRERYRSRLRNSITYPNSIGKDLARISDALESMSLGAFAFTGPAAATVRAPFIDLDTVDIYLPPANQNKELKNLAGSKAEGPPLRFLEPYDLGVFMYAKRYEGIPTVSDVQAYLDLAARGGRDQKQADYLFDNAIEPMWKAT
jgi:DNA-binding PadR family transcriptional regulator